MAPKEEQSHHGGPEHGRLAAYDEGESDEGQSRHHGCGTSRHSTRREHEEDRGGEEGHVEAGDREDVIDTGATERLAGFRRQSRLLAEEQSGHEGGGGLG